ncbi:MAG: peptidase M14 [Chlorobi bacterium]|nr:peptidase M14 [Chlorobiota bacterium]
MKTIITFLLLIILSTAMNAQSLLINSLYENYDSYKEKSITDKRITNADIVKYFTDKKSSENFSFEVAGKSLEGKPIYLVKVGRGATKILAWSQMHGDEPTATMALLDLFNFFTADDHFNDFRNSLFDSLSIYFIPMLNPDGAEKFERRNFASIDLNRDALRLQFPESKILKAVRDSVQPEFGFNLHDQDTRYTSGHSFKNAAISFLAPPFNYARDINDVRKKTMQLIAVINETLQNYIPGHTGRYSDEFEPRAFGDNFVKWGTSSVLIESGGWKDDEDKQYLRKLNFVALLSAFNSIMNKTYEEKSIEEYSAIPENEKYLFDLLLRNVEYKINGVNYTVDIGIKTEEIPADKGFYLKGTIDDFGDLSTYFGFEEIDCSGLTLAPPEIIEKEIYSEKDLQEINFSELLAKGITGIRTENFESEKSFVKFPINIIANEKFSYKIKTDGNADFLLKKGDDLKYAIVNGQIYDVNINFNKIKNGLILK